MLTRSLLVTLLAAALADPAAAERRHDVRAEVPAGVYVTEDNPPCGVTTPSILDIASDPQVQAAAAAAGPEASALVLAIATGNRIAKDCTGGAVCDLFRRLNPNRNRSSCAYVCVSAPAGARITGARTSDRDGRWQTQRISARRLTGRGYNHNSKDYSGWEKIFASYNGDRPMVCGVAKNWSHNRSATMRLRAYYTID